MTEILSGLTGGERIVSSGEFLLDSEASLTGGLERVGSTTEPSDAGSRPSRGDGAPPSHHNPDRQQQP
jgi:Cu(I)/Ag(I) efflux system membrane fusion protein